MSHDTPQYTDSQFKVCARCKQNKPASEYYIRPNTNNLLISECKDCMKERNRIHGSIPPTEPRVKSEIYAIEELRRNGIHAMPGKALSYANVDVVAFGCVRIEVKYSKLDTKFTRQTYSFAFTPGQIARGVLADIIMLICDDGQSRTYHLFPYDDPVFYMQGRMKKGFTFCPGSFEAAKHGNNRIVMIQPMMDAAQNRWSLVWSTLKRVSDRLRITG